MATSRVGRVKDGTLPTVGVGGWYGRKGHSPRSILRSHEFPRNCSFVPPDDYNF